MMNKNKLNIAKSALAGLVLGTAVLTTAGTNAFAFNNLGSGSEVRTILSDDLAQSKNQSKKGSKTEKASKTSEAKGKEAKGKEAKCGEGKCGEKKTESKSEAKAKSTNEKNASESKSKEAKCGEGKCGN